jgi:hypothetical protein
MLRLVAILVVLFLITCNKPIATNKDDTSINLFYSSLSVCSCYKSGMSVLSNLIEYNEQVYKDLFQELRMNCLTKYGTQLFIPSNCNYPDSLQMLQDSLHALGIDVNG